MISAFFRRIFQRGGKDRFRKEINAQLEKFASGEINDIEGAIVLIKTGVPEGVPYLHRALATCNVFVLCQSEDDPKSYLSIHSPGNFRVYVVFTTRARGDATLKNTAGGVLVEQPFYQVLNDVPVGLGIIINPLDAAVRLDIDPPEIGGMIENLLAEAKAMRAHKGASNN